MKNTLVILLVTLSVIACSEPAVTKKQVEATIDNVNRFPLTFKVSKDEAVEALGRAQYCIAKHSKMKIQIATEYCIQTFNPMEAGQFGYEVIKSPVQGDSVEFSVKCHTRRELFSNEIDSVKILNAHALAFYIKNGVMNDDFIK